MIRVFRPLGEVDWLNQVGHLAGGALLTGIPLYLAVAVLPKGLWFLAYSLIPVAVMAFALWREIIWQHANSCGEGCRTDLLGWFVGVEIAVCATAITTGG